MGNQVVIKPTVNCNYLPANEQSILYLAIEIMPPNFLEGNISLRSAICMVIDRSGSMKGQNKLVNAKAAAIQVLDTLRSDDYIGMITFSDYVEPIIDLTQSSHADMIGLRNNIERLKADGNTEMYRGLESAFNQFSRMGATLAQAAKRIILLSDGRPTDRIPPGDYGALAHRMRGAGISITALGVGKDYNEDLMHSIAISSDGTSKHVTDSWELPTVFREETEQTQVIIRSRPQVLLDLNQGVDIKDMYRSSPDSTRISNPDRSEGKIRIPVSDIKATESQILGLKLSVPPMPEGSFRVATVELADDQRSRTDIMVTFTNDAQLYETENNAFPRHFFQIVGTQVQAREGLSGDKTVALQKSIAQLRDIVNDPTLAQNPTLLNAATRALEATTRLLRGGLSDEETKTIKQDLDKTILKDDFTR